MNPPNYQGDFNDNIDEEIMNIGKMEVKDLEFPQVESELQARENQRKLEYS